MFRPSKTQQSFQDRQTYIPPNIQTAMAEQLKHSMPQHLKKYQDGNTYIPEHAQNEIAAHLENSLPAHMKQYAGAYMQQNVVEPSLARQSVGRQPVTVAPVAAEQSSGVAGAGAAPTAGPVQTVQPTQVVQPVQSAVVSGGAQSPQSPDQPYDFINNPEKPPKQSALGRLPGGNSVVARIALIAVGLLVLLIIFSVFKSLLSGAPNLDNLVTAVQEQQELIHLSANAVLEPSISTGNLNFATTMQASLTTSQANTLAYLNTNHKKIKAKSLDLKVSAAIDTQLANAAAASTYNQTFQEIMQSQLNSYGKTLQQAYDLDHGKNGRALLTNEYKQLQLFETQLNTPSN